MTTPDPRHAADQLRGNAAPAAPSARRAPVDPGPAARPALVAVAFLVVPLAGLVARAPWGGLTAS